MFSQLPVVFRRNCPFRILGITHCSMSTSKTTKFIKLSLCPTSTSTTGSPLLRKTQIVTVAACSFITHFQACLIPGLVFVEESGRQFFKLQNEPLESPFNRMVKRVFDIALSIPALLLVLPLAMIFRMVVSTHSVFWSSFLPAGEGRACWS